MAVGSICFRRPTWNAPAGSVGKICHERNLRKILCRSSKVTVSLSPSAFGALVGDVPYEQIVLLAYAAYFVGHEECVVGGGSFWGTPQAAEDGDFRAKYSFFWDRVDLASPADVVIHAEPKNGWDAVAPSVLRVHVGAYTSLVDKAWVDVPLKVTVDAPGGGGRTIDIPRVLAGYLYDVDYRGLPYVDFEIDGNGAVTRITQGGV